MDSRHLSTSLPMTDVVGSCHWHLPMTNVVGFCHFDLLGEICYITAEFSSFVVEMTSLVEDCHFCIRLNFFWVGTQGGSICSQNVKY